MDVIPAQPNLSPIALITGASSGIGAACARKFAAAGWHLILVARRLDKLQALSAELGTPTLCLTLDVRNQQEVAQMLGELPVDWQPVEVLVNNAGLAVGLGAMQDGLTEDWDRMVDTNVKGLAYVIRAIVPGMVARGTGTVVNIGSTAAKGTYPGGAMYCATKHAVQAISDGLRVDLLDTGVRVSTVHPGLVETEFSIVRFKGDTERAKSVYDGLVPLSGEDVADVVFYVANAPKHLTISDLVVVPKAQADTHYVKRNL
jgi:NADP-dependent 3-hydroxy acid dehydrogenase YdfG